MMRNLLITALALLAFAISGIVEAHYIAETSKGKCLVECTKVPKCRQKLADAVKKCGDVEKECIMGQFSDGAKKRCNLKCN